ncbi:MAG TPA: DEAD/DEAH box helicase family protein [Acidimicrobiales bacterium]|jgi:superfamily II DNA or RNA helicase|nr:DEAD/DEAH box helicase family protein [Acidimicrobiales bacterium]
MTRQGRSVTLRPWQRDALEAFARRRQDDFLAVACPGAGKTTLALAASRQFLGGEPKPVVVVVPTQHLKFQWAEAAARFGVHLDPLWTEKSGLAPDMHGLVTTYAQVSSSAAAIGSACAGGIAVLDEVHHAADDRAWGDGVSRAFERAACRLLLSGTPFRTDDNPIPFVRYSFGDYGDAVADYEYGYGEALRDGGVVRPVFFPRFDGHMEWRGADGEERAAGFNDDLTRDQWGARLRTALSLDGEWLPTVLSRAHERLIDVRRAHPGAGGLVVAIDHEHARGIARLLKRLHRVDAKVALSDDPRASHGIAQFAASDDPWIVAVRMISEGVDIPRLRVGVFATTTATSMFFRQAVGRIARWTPGLRSQRAYLYLPDDPRLRGHALGIAQARRHSIELRRQAREAAPGEFDDRRIVERADAQMSLFAALSSTAVDVVEAPIDGLDPHEDLLAEPADARAFTIDLPPPPPLPGRLADLDGTPATGSRRGEKTRLRERNASLVTDIARVTGLGHRAVNAELNRLAGVLRIDEATVDQLHRRADQARRWLDAPGSFVVGRAPAPSPTGASSSTSRQALPPPSEVDTPAASGDVVESRLAELRKVLGRDR